MRYLIDTHALLWCAQGDESLPPGVRTILSEEECFYSVASLWEVAIKQSIGKLDVGFSVSELDMHCREAAMGRLSIETPYLERIKTLPDIHRDPFDRLLVAQALEEGLAIVTCDRMIPQYPVQTIW